MLAEWFTQDYGWIIKNMDRVLFTGLMEENTMEILSMIK